VANLIMIIKFGANLNSFSPGVTQNSESKLITIINLENSFSPPEVWRAGSFARLRWYETPRVRATTNNTTTQRWQDLAVGKVVKVGTTNYVKVADDQWLAMENPLCNDPVLLYPGSSKSFSYTGAAQSYTFYQNCQYRVELWGASGAQNYTDTRGKAGYVSGKIVLTDTHDIYLFIGQNNNRTSWDCSDTPSVQSSVFNGTTSGSCASGGGASDLRFFQLRPNENELLWYSDTGLNSRLIVASGSGGAIYNVKAGDGGGLIGYIPSNSTTAPANQTSMFFGIGTGHTTKGGGGWYGGANGEARNSGGGSSYISGHTGCVAIAEGSTTNPRAVRKAGCTTGTTDNECSIHYSGITFTDTVMIDGAGYAWTNVKGALQAMPNPAGGYYASGVGHTGNGAARITRLN